CKLGGVQVQPRGRPGAHPESTPSAPPFPTARDREGEPRRAAAADRGGATAGASAVPLLPPEGPDLRSPTFPRLEASRLRRSPGHPAGQQDAAGELPEIGRASWREGVEVSWGA